MSENRHGVVIAGWRYCFAVAARPFSAIGLRDLACFSFIQTRPAFLEGSKTFPPIITGARLDAQVVVKIAQMNFGSFAECHFCRNVTIPIAHPFAVLFEKYCELGLRHAQV